MSAIKRSSVSVIDREKCESDGVNGTDDPNLCLRVSRKSAVNQQCDFDSTNRMFQLLTLQKQRRVLERSAFSAEGIPQLQERSYCFFYFTPFKHQTDKAAEEFPVALLSTT